MGIEENKEVVRREIEEIWNKGNLEIADEIIADDFVFYRKDSPNIKGPEWYKGAYHFLKTAFPDLHITIEDMIAEGDRVTIRTTWRGTHKGEYMGITPTGRQFLVTEIGISRHKDGKIIEGWGGVDRFDLMQQLSGNPTN
jgi:steroid delta-isomerase-like uncharacterized protein